ncbi:thymidylate kinase [Actinoplanes sp. NBRC 103695]|nr:thymidylate kinase [Actinoplanes sp. NBRC 103695]
MTPLSTVGGVPLNSPFPRSVALIGIDGSGKTTQAHRLAETLAAEGVRAVYRRNAGGRHFVGRIAAWFGRPDAEALVGRRAMLVIESVLRWGALVRTLLRRAVTGETAVMDRYAYCQYASMRSHRAKPVAERRARLAYRLFPAPDVTLLLAVSPVVAQARIDARGYDHEELDYLERADAAYRSLPEFGSFVVIDANGTPDEVAAALRAALPAWEPSLIPHPRASALLAGSRSTVLAFGSLLAGVAVLGYQLLESF